MDLVRKDGILNACMADVSRRAELSGRSVKVKKFLKR